MAVAPGDFGWFPDELGTTIRVGHVRSKRDANPSAFGKSQEVEMKRLHSVLFTVGGLILLGVFGVGVSALFSSLSGGRTPGAAGYPMSSTPRAAEAYPAPQLQPGVTPTIYPTGVAGISKQITSTTVISVNDASAMFDPKTYAMPSSMAGYMILAVVTSQNTACLQPGEKILVLQSTDTTVDNFLKHAPSGTITAGLVSAGLNPSEWEISIVGPGSTLNDLVASTQKSNSAILNTGDCGPVTTGGPVRATPGVRKP
jgi:hypothetical protein